MYKLALKRPIATLMYALTLMIFGYLSFKSMPSALFPNVDFPLVTVKTYYPGADAATVESQITDKIEEAVSGIEGVDSITSSSSEGVSVVIVKFFLERNIDEAANDVRDKVSAVELPRDARKPLVSKLDIGAASIINIFVTAKHDNIKDLMLFVDEKLKPAIQKIQGVGAVNIIGYKDREIRIFPDIDALNKYGITIRELNSIIQKENLKLGGGKLISKTKETILKTKADALTKEELENISLRDGLLLRDVAKVVDGVSDAKSFSSYNDQEGVMIEVQKISGANTIEVVNRLKEKIPLFKHLAKDDFGIYLLQDTTPFIINSLEDVKFDLIYGAILAVIIIFLFLRNFTITIVSSLSIPIAILGTIALMDFMGYNLNKLTLIGLTLSIGIIIDDAIVVLENIYKKLEEGMGRFEAALYGIKEMAFAIMAISAMLLAVFIPVANMSGIVGKFFESFAITVAFAIIISFTIVLTFIPSLSARVLHGKQSSFYLMTEPIFRKIERWYQAVLEKILRHSFLTMIVVVAVFVASLALFPKIGMDFLPKEDKSEFEVKIKADPSISLAAMIKHSKEVQHEIMQNSDVVFTTLNIAYNASREKNKALIYVKLKPKDKRKLSQEEIIEQTREALKRFSNEMFITVAAIPNIKGVGVSVPYQIVLKSDSFEDLKIAKEKLVDYLAKKRGFKDIDTNLDEGRDQIDIKIIRQNAAKYGITAKQIAEAIQVAFSSDIAISYMTKKAKQYDITLRLPDSERISIDDIKKLQLRAKNNELVFLDGLVEFVPTKSQSTIHHFDRQRQVTVFADLYGLDLGSAIDYTLKGLREILPSTVSYRFTGFAEEMGKTNKAFAMAIGLSVILMFIILAILYESLIQPIIIMTALPLSIVGVLIALYLSHQHFSLFVMIGFMLLMGMVGKNAVLLVDFANMAITKGKSVNEALIEAGEKRLRPILMTTFAMIFAMIPLAIASGLGSETKAPMAISIIGGLISSMLLTLLVVPIIYKIIYPLDRWLRKWYETQSKEL